MESRLNKDIFGRKINIGDAVVYGIRSGNSGGIRYGIVIALEWGNKDKDGWHLHHGLKVVSNSGSISNPSSTNMVIVQPGTIPDYIEEKLREIATEKMVKQ